MKCLACWEEIEEGEKVCIHCGSNQEDVKDFLTLALLSQQKKKITVAESTPILEYVFQVDPSTKDDVTISSAAAVTSTKSPETLSKQIYSPSKPSWLATPDITEKPAPIQQKVETKEKTIKCPECEREVPVRKFCKYCGKQLQKACTNCEKMNSINAKFCTSCGTTFDSQA